VTEEQTPARSPRRAAFIGVGLGVALAIGAALLLTRDDDSPVRTLRGDVPPSDTDAATPDPPAFRFTKVTRELVRTGPGRITRRQRQAGARVAATARAVLTDLYVEAFLDPANWGAGRYEDAFRGFTRDAAAEAGSRPALLTAGVRAGDRYERILPKSGRIATRILLDRAGNPTLVVSAVRFSAVASGPRPATLRSTGQFFLERVGRSWKVVSFHVTRTDRLRGAG
jgi:hypothetical protein